MAVRIKSSRKKPKPLPHSSCAPDDPWALVWGQPHIDVDRLTAAIEFDLQSTRAPDFRTRLLVRDAARAIKSFWGQRRFAQWLASSAVREHINRIIAEDLGKPGFRYIRRRLVANPNRADIVSKLSSKVEKHQQDLRVMAKKLDKQKAKERLVVAGKAFLDDPRLRPKIEANWKFIFREPLFPDDATK